MPDDTAINPHRNPAARLTAIFERAKAVGKPSSPSVDVWAQTFDVPDSLEASRRFVEVGRQLGLALDLVDEVRARAASTGMPVENYENALRRVAKALSPRRTLEQWSTSVGFLDDASLTAIRFLEWWPQDGEDLRLGSIYARLLEDVHDLEALLLSPELDDEFQRRTLALLDALKRAVRDYPISGGAALARAHAQLMADWADLPEAKSPKERAVRDRLRHALGWVVVAGTLTLGAVRNAGLIARTAKDVIEVIPTVKEAIGLAPGGEVIKLPPGEGDSHLLPSGPEEPDFTVDIDAP